MRNILALSGLLTVLASAPATAATVVYTFTATATSYSETIIPSDVTTPVIDYLATGTWTGKISFDTDDDSQAFTCTVGQTDCSSSGNVLSEYAFDEAADTLNLTYADFSNLADFDFAGTTGSIFMSYEFVRPEQRAYL